MERSYCTMCIYRIVRIRVYIRLLDTLAMPSWRAHSHSHDVECTFLRGWLLSKPIELLHKHIEFHCAGTVGLHRKQQPVGRIYVAKFGTCIKSYMLGTYSRISSPRQDGNVRVISELYGESLVKLAAARFDYLSPTRIAL